MSDNIKLQILKGFRELYPAEKAAQNYVLEKAYEIAKLFGFEEYDGPILEPIDLYLNKSSRELVEDQSFKVVDKNNKTYLMRPEMTPTLARMIAKKENTLTFPVRYFNAGLRYRYEAPQKGRDREFYQMDYDIIGSNNDIAEIEILSTIVALFTSFGATKKDFVIYINSRSVLTKTLFSFGISQNLIKNVISIIDKKEKVTPEAFIDMLKKETLSTDQINKINNMFNDTNAYKKEFSSTLSLVKKYGIDEYIEVNPAIVRGLDYYTGIVFEAKSKGTLTRSLFGGGRYDNLIEDCGGRQKLGGVGFAVSDSIMLAFLSEFNLLPTLNPVPTKILVTLFDEKTVSNAIDVCNKLRSNGISTELYPMYNTKLEKQLKYADKKQIPYVAIIGPDEVKNNTVTLKDLKNRKQVSYTIQQVIDKLIKEIN